MSRAETEAVVKRYFASWPNGDFEAMRSCFGKPFEFDSGSGLVTDPDQLTKSAAAGPQWTGVKLIASVYENNTAALLYEATNPDGNTKMRVGEFTTVADGTIRSIRAVISGVS